MVAFLNTTLGPCKLVREEGKITKKNFTNFVYAILNLEWYCSSMQKILTFATIEHSQESS